MNFSGNYNVHCDFWLLEPFWIVELYLIWCNGIERFLAHISTFWLQKYFDSDNNFDCKDYLVKGKGSWWLETFIFPFCDAERFINFLKGMFLKMFQNPTYLKIKWISKLLCRHIKIMIVTDLFLAQCNVLFDPGENNSKFKIMIHFYTFQLK